MRAFLACNSYLKLLLLIKRVNAHENLRRGKDLKKVLRKDLWLGKKGKKTGNKISVKSLGKPLILCGVHTLELVNNAFGDPDILNMEIHPLRRFHKKMLIITDYFLEMINVKSMIVKEALL